MVILNVFLGLFNLMKNDILDFYVVMGFVIVVVD